MKLAIWCWTILGLLPCAYLTTLVFSYRDWLVLRQKMSWGGDSAFIHNTYFRLQFGETTLEIFPRYWAFALLIAGIVAIIVSLIALLHIPTRESAG